MRGGALPPSLVLVALALALASAPREARLPSVIALLAAATTVVSMPLPLAWTDAVFLGCWTSVIVCALAIYLPRGVATRCAIALSANAGIWSGAVVALSGSQLDALKALTIAAAFLIAASIARRRAPIALKVVASWLIGVAILAATLQSLSVTPGYLPDHME